MIHLWRSWLLWLAVLGMAVPCFTEAVHSAFPVVQLKTGGHLIRAEVAATLEARDIGLMNRRSLPVDHGMLFVFPEARRHCMWMRNTHIPLSVAFLDNTGTIVNIENMQPDTELDHCAARPVRYALEMEQGWFQKQGLAAGSQIRGLKKAPRGK